MPQLGRFSKTFSSPQTGLPRSGADVTIYREGATASGTQVLNIGSETLTVRHRGKIENGDVVFIGTATGTTYSVSNVTDTTMDLAVAGAVTVNNGDRVIPSNNLIDLFGDDQGGATTANPTPTSVNGLAEAYLESAAIDYIVAGGGAAATLFQGNVSGSEHLGQVRYADQFADGGSTTGGIQEAIDDLPSAGGVVQLSANTTYTISTAIDLEQGIWLRGGGPSTVISPSGTFPAPVAGETDGLVRSPNVGGVPKYNLAVPGNYSTVSDIRFDGLFSTLARPFNNCIDLYGITDVMIRDVICEDGEQFAITVSHARRASVIGCVVRQFPDDANSNGITVSGDNATPTSGTNCVITGCVVEDIGTIGINVQTMEGVTITGNNLRSCRYGIVAEGDDDGVGAGGGPVRNLTISGNTLIGTTDTNEGGTTQNKLGIVLWLNATSGGGDTSGEHYNINVSGNTIKDYDTAFNAGGGHWNFSDNNIYNYGNGGASTSGVLIGTVFGSNLKMSNFAILNNYFQQTTRAASGTVAAIIINNGTVGLIDNVVIRGNVINGQDVAAGGSTQYGIYITSVGDNWDISDNYFRGTTNQPIRVLTNNTAAAAPTNWRFANNYFADCVAKSGEAAATYISLADANNFTWSQIAIVGNVALDSNSQMLNLVTNAGTGWAGALHISGNVVKDATTEIAKLIDPGDAFIGPTRNITAVGDVIAPITDVYLLNPDAGYTLSANPTITVGYNGQKLRLINITANALVFQDGNGLTLEGGLDQTLNQYDSIELMYLDSAADWVQMGPIGNVN